MGMVINKMVNKVRPIRVQRVVEIEVLRHTRVTIDGHKVCCPGNAVHLDNFESGLAMAIEFGCHDPHACVRVAFVTVNKPIDQCARVALAPILERKEQLHAPDFHALHARLRIISDDKYGITAWVTKEARSRLN